MAKRSFHLLIPSFILGILIIFSSCADTKKLAYFNYVLKDSLANIQQQPTALIIKRSDVLKVSVTSLDDLTTKIFNSMPTVNASSASITGSSDGYLVDDNGLIKLPLIGNIKAVGLTKEQLEATITKDLTERKFAIDPIVTVRIINYKITVLGEVNKPGVIPVGNERITIMEAIGAAGDLTIYGRRDNILLIREINGKRIYKRFSLNDDALFDKEFYYLQNQDLIYITPNNAKAALSDRTTQLLPILLSSLSLITVIISQVIR